MEAILSVDLVDSYFALYSTENAKENWEQFEKLENYESTLLSIEKRISSLERKIAQIVICCDEETLKMAKTKLMIDVERIFQTKQMKIVGSRSPVYTKLIFNSRQKFFPGQVLILTRLRNDEKTGLQNFIAAFFTIKYGFLVFFKSFETTNQFEFLQLAKNYKNQAIFFYIFENENQLKFFQDLNQNQNSRSFFVKKEKTTRVLGGLIIGQACLPETAKSVPFYCPVKELADFSVIPDDFDFSINLAPKKLSSSKITENDFQTILDSTFSGKDMENSRYYVGIDVGTCHSVIARQHNGLCNSAIIDSAVFVKDNGQLVVGTENDVDVAILGCIKFLGKTQEFSDNKQSDVAVIPNRNGILLGVGNHRFQPELVVSKLMEHLLEILMRDKLAQEVKVAVIAVPSRFTENQKTALEVAAYLAGITPILIPVPTAVIFATLPNLKNLEENVLVIHVGGFSTDFAVFRTGKTIKQLSTPKFTNFCGRIFDDKIFEIFCEKTKKNLSWNYIVQKECKRIKNFFNTKSEATMNVGSDEAHLSADIFDPIFAKFKITISNIFANTKSSKFSKVVLAGSCTKMPKIKQIVESCVNPNIPVELLENPETVVARGCAIYSQEFFKIFASKTQ